MEVWIMTHPATSRYVQLRELRPGLWNLYVHQLVQNSLPTTLPNCLHAKTEICYEVLMYDRGNKCIKPVEYTDS